MRSRYKVTRGLHPQKQWEAGRAVSPPFSARRQLDSTPATLIREAGGRKRSSPLAQRRPAHSASRFLNTQQTSDSGNRVIAALGAVLSEAQVA